MKSVGEVMAIGRNFEESFQKAIRQIDPSYIGFQGDHFDNLDEALANPTDRRWLAVGQALLHENYTVDQVHELTKIDRWFLHKLMNIVNMYRELEANGHLSIINHDLMSRAKKLGFSDKQIGLCVGADELEVRRVRKELGIIPFVKKLILWQLNFLPIPIIYTPLIMPLVLTLISMIKVPWCWDLEFIELGLQLNSIGVLFPLLVL